MKSKNEITKILDNTECHEKIAEAINLLNFDFIENVERICSTDSCSLNESLNDLLRADNGKRTQQNFYILWVILRGLQIPQDKNLSQVIKKAVMGLMDDLHTTLSVEAYISKIKQFRAPYLAKQGRLLNVNIADVCDVVKDDTLLVEDQLIFVHKDNRITERVAVTMDLNMIDQIEEYLCIHVERDGILPEYIASIITSQYFYDRNNLQESIVAVHHIFDFQIPYLNKNVQEQYKKLFKYIERSSTVRHRTFFTRMLDLMVAELYNEKLFFENNLSFIELAKELPVLGTNDVREIEIFDTFSSNQSKISAAMVRAISMVDMAK